MKEIFVKSVEELEKLEAEYNLVDCGMSGKYHSYHWLQDDEAEVAVYYDNSIFED